MKRNILFILLSIFLSAFVVSSCEDVLDVQPLDAYTEENIFSDISLTQAYVTEMYTTLITGFDDDASMYISDEARNNFNWGSSYTIIRGEMTADDCGGFGTWQKYYSDIKACNIFFRNVDKIPAQTADDKVVKNYLIGEVTFMRAMYYMDLTTRYGGVPLITKPFDLNDKNIMLARNSYDSCADFVVDEFEKAAGLLPVSWSGSNFGRATKGAALAMKARMLLYMASPLWNPDNDKAKWQKAADAAKAVIDLRKYSLDPDYKGLFLNPLSPEIIFERLYTTEHSNYFDWEQTPNGQHGYSACCVLQQMVDSYEMEDGTMPDTTMYTKVTSNPWAGRDPRFYASIVCDGQPIRGVEAQFWINEDGKTGGNDSEFGYDNWNVSDTHYTLRKFLDESLTAQWEDWGSQPWIYARLAEVYLNYAEAECELGKDIEARKYVNLIRARARGGRTGILPDVTESGEALMKKIRQERKVELAFEGFRYWDVRRWKIADSTENFESKGIKIIRHPDGTKSYSIVHVDNRVFKPQHYLFPIPNSEIRKDDLLKQNPGY
ncbi:MAG: RagB/SusD family nutrient uptake outer membrane protein [Bacteroidales bacterium]|jgi:hypothetical protein|nr:RagB/SusD family nutrient uptake outer membrane protein [Bacteroidales bacterium]